MNQLINLLCAGASLLLVSCGTSGNLSVPRVIYQSIRTEYAQPAVIPENAQIAVTYLFNERGEMQPIVNNLTGDVMIIDQTKSFVIMTRQSYRRQQATSTHKPAARHSISGLLPMLSE